jgi:hypothetical protein
MVLNSEQGDYNYPMLPLLRRLCYSSMACGMLSLQLFF